MDHAVEGEAAPSGVYTTKRRDAMDLRGCHIPLVTPFLEDGRIDEPGLRKLVNHLIEVEKVDGLVPCGTTGESPTLTHDEHGRVIQIVVEEARKRVPVIAGTGSNSTQEAIGMTRHAEESGADATLQVCPYYNKPTQEGLVAHFRAVADASPRARGDLQRPRPHGVNIEPETVARLAEEQNIVGVKDACGQPHTDHAHPGGTRRRATPYVLSGEDALTFAMMSMRRHGVIWRWERDGQGVAAQMVHLIVEGRLEEALEIHYLHIAAGPGPLHRDQPHSGQGGDEHDGPPCRPSEAPSDPDEVREPGVAASGTAGGGAALVRQVAEIADLSAGDAARSKLPGGSARPVKTSLEG